MSEYTYIDERIGYEKIICLILTVLVMATAFVSTVGAVNYSDLQPTLVLSSDKGYYVNSDLLTDDYMQLRANCYGFAIRMHYQNKVLPDEETVNINGVDTTIYCYKQQPGEFYDRTSSQVSYSEMMQDLMYAGTSQVYQAVRQDLFELGYTAQIVAQITNTSYVPPSAETDTTRRQIIVVTGERRALNPYTGGYIVYNDYHFYMQNSDNTWSHKRGAAPATGYCGDHPTVALNNNNISQHIHCCNYDNPTALLFSVDAPGITDKDHVDGHTRTPSLTPIYVTRVPYCDEAGGIVKTAKALPGISNLSRTGYIDHKGDVDNYIFDVEESGTYSIEFLTDTDHQICFQFAEVTNVNYVSFGTVYATSTGGRKVIYRDLVAGKRYCLRVYLSNQVTDDDRFSLDYVFNIFP